MRCLALAQAARAREVDVAFATAECPPALAERFGQEAFEIVRMSASVGTNEDAEKTVALARRMGVDWIVVDGYQFSSAYQRALKAAGQRLLVLDDYGHADHYTADIVLNQNLGAEEDLYRSRAAYTRLLLGLRYVLLRREFRQNEREERTHPALARRLLVTIGGSDPAGLTARVLQAVNRVEARELEALVVLGPANAQREELFAAIGRVPERIRVLDNPADLAPHMRWADMALTAGGSTLWELLHLGVPSLVVVVAENQKRATALVHSQDACRVIGESASITPEQIASHLRALAHNAEERELLGTTGTNLIDGRGAERVLDALFSEV